MVTSMKSPARIVWLVLTFCFSSATSGQSQPTAAPAVELRDGDRIVLIGGTLIEREQRYGYWEHALTAAHPGKRLTFRNLGWSADTVWAESRGLFDPPAKGYERLIQQVADLKPTLLLLNYGQNEAWAGPEGLDRFLTQYRKLLGDLTQTGPVRCVFLSPLPMEPGTGPQTNPEEYNAKIALYSAAIARLAAERGEPFIDLRNIYDWHTSQPAPGSDAHEPLTSNGLHFTEYGYWRTAEWLRNQLCPESGPSSLVFPKREATTPIVLPPVDSGRLTQNVSLLEIDARVNALPLPTLGHHLPTGPILQFTAATPGVYQWQTSGQPVETHRDTDWQRGLPLTHGPDATQSLDLLSAIRKKNELYFHRWRPQNVTYLFLFRKHEQGQNAAEIPQFDPLIAAEEDLIASLAKPHTRTFSIVRLADK